LPRKRLFARRKASTSPVGGAGGVVVDVVVEDVVEEVDVDVVVEVDVDVVVEEVVEVVVGGGVLVDEAGLATVVVVTVVVEAEDAGEPGEPGGSVGLVEAAPTLVDVAVEVAGSAEVG
jgi:hypothetical protein